MKGCAAVNNTIKSVDRGSPAEKAGISAGDRLLTINGHKIHDVLDYKYYSYDARLAVELLSASGQKKHAVIRKPDGEDAGLEFESYLIDTARACANKCVFCFVDQLPRGMRSTLYFKDDDHRLSFLQGNYITLTNLSEREIRRIMDLRISPINVSVHSTEPELRSMLLGSKNGGRGIEIMREFAGAGITMNC
jgi:putative radical SAM enzyme (TIGR03279 family)